MSIYRQIQMAEGYDIFDIVMSDDSLELDGAFGLIETYKEEFPELETLYEITDEWEKILLIDTIFTDKVLLFVTCSNGTDSLAYKVDSALLVKNNIEQYGKVYGENYVPVSQLPNLWETPGNQIEEAIDEYVLSLFPGALDESSEKPWWRFW